ncbi:MAG: EamA family transporter [Bacillota bacterium]
MNEKVVNRSKLLLILSTFLFGTIGIFRKFIPLPSSLIALARGVIGMLFLLMVVFIKKDKLSWNAIRRNLLFLCLSGAMIGINWILLFEAYRYTTVATATLCYYMAPMFVILVSPLFFKEKLTGKKILCVAVALIGMVFVSGILQTGFTGIGDLTGILLGLGAALLYAGIVILNMNIKNVSAYDKTIVQLAVAAVILLPYTLLSENLAQLTFSPLTIVMLIILGALQTGIGYALYFGSIEHLRTQTVALLSYIDPVVAILLSAVFLREQLTLWGVVGAILVLGSTLISELPIGEKKQINADTPII